MKIPLHIQCGRDESRVLLHIILIYGYGIFKRDKISCHGVNTGGKGT